MKKQRAGKIDAVFDPPRKRVKYKVMHVKRTAKKPIDPGELEAIRSLMLIGMEREAAELSIRAANNLEAAASKKGAAIQRLVMLDHDKLIAVIQSAVGHTDFADRVKSIFLMQLTDTL